MFRLLDSGLPKDPVYHADLKGLGYFINDEDEIRSMENPRAYFNFFLTKNERYNDVQREAMNCVIREEIYKRLHSLGLNTIRLPLGAQEFQPNVPIFVSDGIEKKKRVIILFYEHTQDLGVFAHRVIGGRGGINEGSAVNFVKHIQSLPSGPGNNDSPGIILANMGQLRWWRRGKKAVTQTTWFALPQRNAVSGPIRFDTVKNVVPGNRNVAEHVDYVFSHVVKELVDSEAKLDVIGVSDGAVQVVEYMNRDPNWDALKHRMNALALLASFHHKNDLQNPDFAAWLRKRGRAYIVSQETANIPVADPDGGQHTSGFGCAAYSLGEPYYSELMLPKGCKTVLDWLQQVAYDPGYENPEVYVLIPEEKEGWGDDKEQMVGWGINGGAESAEGVREVDAFEAKSGDIKQADVQAANIGEVEVDADEVQPKDDALAKAIETVLPSSEHKTVIEEMKVDDAEKAEFEGSGVATETYKFQSGIELLRANATENASGTSQLEIDTDVAKIKGVKKAEFKAVQVVTETGEVKAGAYKVQADADVPKAGAAEFIVDINVSKIDTDPVKVTTVKDADAEAKDTDDGNKITKAKTAIVDNGKTKIGADPAGADAVKNTKAKGSRKTSEITTDKAEIQALILKLQTFRTQIEADKARCKLEIAMFQAQADKLDVEAEAKAELEVESSRVENTDEGIEAENTGQEKRLTALEDSAPA